MSRTTTNLPSVTPSARQTGAETSFPSPLDSPRACLRRRATHVRRDTQVQYTVHNWCQYVLPAPPRFETLKLKLDFYDLVNQQISLSIHDTNRVLADLDLEIDRFAFAFAFSKIGVQKPATATARSPQSLQSTPANGCQGTLHSTFHFHSPRGFLYRSPGSKPYR